MIASPFAPLSSTLFPRLDQNPPSPSAQCAPTSAVMVACYADPAIPCTVAERQALTNVLGDRPWSTSDLETAVRRRYGVTLRHPGSVAAFLGHLRDRLGLAIAFGNNGIAAAELQHGYTGIHAKAIGPAAATASGELWVFVRDPIDASGYWLPWQGHGDGWDLYDWLNPVTSNAWIVDRDEWAILRRDAKIAADVAEAARQDARIATLEAELAAADPVAAWNDALTAAGAAVATLHKAPATA